MKSFLLIYKKHFLYIKSKQEKLIKFIELVLFNMNFINNCTKFFFQTFKKLSNNQKIFPGKIKVFKVFSFKSGQNQSFFSSSFSPDHEHMKNEVLY